MNSKARSMLSIAAAFIMVAIAFSATVAVTPKASAAIIDTCPITIKASATSVYWDEPVYFEGDVLNMNVAGGCAAPYVQRYVAASHNWIDYSGPADVIAWNVVSSGDSGHYKIECTHAPFAGEYDKETDMTFRVAINCGTWRWVSGASTPVTIHISPRSPTPSPLTLETLLSLSASTTTPIAGKPYTLSGLLVDESLRKLGGMSIKIWYRHDGESTGQSFTVQTGDDGRYSVTAISTKKVYLRAVFEGDKRGTTTFLDSKSDLVTVTPQAGAMVATHLTLTPSTTTPIAGKPYTLSGYLNQYDKTGKPLAGKPIDIWVRHEGETTGHLWKTVYTQIASGTASDVKYSTTAVSSQKVYLRAVFQGGVYPDGAYAGSKSDLVTVTPQKIATSVDLTTSTTTPIAGRPYTLSGSLSDGTGKALANKPIDIWIRHDGDNGILWKTMTTDSNGKYSTTAISTTNAYVRVVFGGDSTYNPSKSALVTIKPSRF